MSALMQNGPPDAANAGLQLSVHSVPAHEALLVKIQPPAAPKDEVHHVPCSIVLVIDISSSMSFHAVAPGAENETACMQLTVLDIVRHSALTIIENMDKRDNLGIVVFHQEAEELFPLTPMTLANKVVAERKVRRMKTKYGTNIWAGLEKGLDMFVEAETAGKVPAIMILSDGVPDYRDPLKHATSVLHRRLPIKPSIHTFGFGYITGAALLASIARIGDGNYAYISDPGMVGTVFVHAMALLQSTFATGATLQLDPTEHLKIYDGLQQRTTVSGDGSLTVHLGNIHYGQSRDIVLKVKSSEHTASDDTTHYVGVKVNLTAIGEARPQKSVSVRQCLATESSLPEHEIAYHVSRAYLCSFFAVLLGAQSYGDISIPETDFDTRQRRLAKLLSSIPARNYSDEQNQSLMKELVGGGLAGQIHIALSTDEHYMRWGKRYLPSLFSAHARQICNSFKDPGPLQYNTNSELFKLCRSRLERTFNLMPPPMPVEAVSYSSSASTVVYRGETAHKSAASHMHKVTKSGRAGRSSQSVGKLAQVLEHAILQSAHASNDIDMTPDGQKTVADEQGGQDKQSQQASMMSYNASAVCFAHGTPVVLESGNSIEIHNLRSGASVQTLSGTRRVVGLLRTHVENEVLCELGSILVTAWHPVSFDGATWQFPVHLTVKPIMYTGDVYSILLEADSSPFAHAVQVGGLWGACLGHGITDEFNGSNDVRAHKFFGDYIAVCDKMALLRPVNGAYQSYGVVRDEVTGLVNGFRAVKARTNVGGNDGQPCNSASSSSVRA